MVKVSQGRVETPALRGVNLGGWLVLEKWLTPSLFNGLVANDERSFCVEVGARKRELLREHRETFITESDFAWLAAQGINAVRLPVGHWVFGSVEPYVGCIEYVDRAFEYAERQGLLVVLDLHTAPGSQNGAGHSGQRGRVGWHENTQNIAETVDVLARLAERYGKRPSLWGIELLNEPSEQIPKSVLINFYQVAYERVRDQAHPEVKVIIADQFRPYAWQDQLASQPYENTVQDSHFYQAFGYFEKRMTIEQHITKVTDEWSRIIKEATRSKPLIIGEWSLGLDDAAYAGMNVTQRNAATRAYGTAQLATFERAAGWFFWTYKKEQSDHWDFRHSLAKGWLSLPAS